MTRIYFSLATALTFLAHSGVARSQTQFDPTRPPDAWLAAQQGAGGLAPKAPEASAGVNLLLVGKGRALAVVDGQLLKPGEKHDGARVLAIRADGVLVRSGESTQSLKLAPAVDKKPSIRPGVAGKTAATSVQSGNQ